MPRRQRRGTAFRFRLLRAGHGRAQPFASRDAYGRDLTTNTPQNPCVVENLSAYAVHQQRTGVPVRTGWQRRCCVDNNHGATSRERSTGWGLFRGPCTSGFSPITPGLVAVEPISHRMLLPVSQSRIKSRAACWTQRARARPSSAWCQFLLTDPRYAEALRRGTDVGAMARSGCTPGRHRPGRPAARDRRSCAPIQCKF